MEKIRKPAVAGQFYEANKISLLERIKECFLDDRGPGRFPKITKGDKKVKGLVVPHAGYIYSGAIAAHAYYFLTINGFAETFIIIGPNHTGMGSGVAVMTEGIWQTPLGEVPINNNLAKNLFKGIIDKDENAHYYEHSIEVQLPFLQFCSENKKFDFVPICMAMQDFETSDEIGRIIAEAVKKENKNVVIIASSDFSHAGFNYMNMPSDGLRVDYYAEKQDKRAIKQILELNPAGLIKTVQLNNISMCGYGPVAAMLTASKILGAKKAELLKYGTSYEVHPSTSCVGYGALAVY
ncbi:MAG: MEMO1 family protein [Candidatus Thermoplasmatota archaeon]|nr:MEMO1 family protein [Candidatus Thermoplasmatota archaeon]